MADRYYVNCSLAPGPVTIQGPEAHHLAAVCRVRPGDLVCLFNGDGREYSAKVDLVERRSVSLEVIGAASPERELPYPLEVAAPVPKGDRAQFLLEKLTELGATSFVPLRTARSVVHPHDAKLDKLKRYVIEASKQCGRNVLLNVAALTDWTAHLNRTDLPAARLVAHPPALPETGQVSTSITPLERRTHRSASIAMAIGPEGGFTDEEIHQAIQAGWQAVSLGPRILRVETAALVMAAWASNQ